MVEAIQCADAKNWTNILAIVELLFCLPISNCHLERVFSHTKLIKGEWRSSLGEDQLDDLSVEAPHPSNWDASGAVELWWRDKTCRVIIADTRATPRLASTSSASTSSDGCTNSSFSMENWESWLENSDQLLLNSVVSHTLIVHHTQTVQPSRYCRDSTALEACVPNPAYTLVGTRNVPRSASSRSSTYAITLLL